MLVLRTFSISEPKKALQKIERRGQSVKLESKPVGIVSWLILGLIAGFIGSKIVNKSGKGFFLDIALGIVGAVVGGSLFSLLGAQGITGLNVYSMIVAIIGSVVVLWGYHAVTGR